MVGADGQRWSPGRMLSVAREELGELGVEVVDLSAERSRADALAPSLIHAIANPRRVQADTKIFNLF